jgi:4-alpha-glucanotransferase
MTSQNSKGPSRDWLAIVKSTQAKNKINQWFKTELKDDNITRGKELISTYCKAKSIVLSDILKPDLISSVIRKYGFRDWDSVLAALGHGGLKEGQIVNKLLEEYKKKLAEEIEYQSFVQYAFYAQWQDLKAYAAANQVKIIGDMPLYAAADSCEVWVNRELFKLDEQGKPRCVAGVPPDYFSATGQRWDNPVYDWVAHAATDYSWWKKRIKQTLRLFDYTRIDHFRGLEAYWEIDAREETAIKGRWLKGPGKCFFESLFRKFENLPLLAEDLGIITPEVETLRKIFGFRGMKVLQFTPLSEMTDRGDSQFIYYSGTHDNDTLLGWYKTTLENAMGASGSSGMEEECRQECCRLIAEMYMSQAAWVILPLQDILGLDSEARMNVPGTMGKNWQWQVSKELLTEEVRKDLRNLTDRAQRNRPNSEQ